MAEVATMADNQKGYETELKEYISKERSAIDLISSVGHLLYERSVELVLFRNHLTDKSISDVLNLHVYAEQVVNKPIKVADTAELAKELMALNLAPSKLDIGLLASQWMEEGSSYVDKAEFLTTKLADFIGQDKSEIKPKDVVLYGFGRIGRLCARELIKQAGKGQQLRLRAIVTRRLTEAELEKRAALLRNDSVHGAFRGSVQSDFENKALIINGQIVKMIVAKNPEEIDYTEHGLEDVLVIDNTGVFTDKEALGRHLKSKGASKVLLTAPGKGIPNIVYGINHRALDLETTDIYSAASCTTNAISPVLAVIEEKIGVERGHIETVHAYTNDQNLLDNMHSKPRRGRSAAMNMVITSTGAGNAVVKVVPSLEGKLTANAVRVPTPNGSLAVLSLTLKTETTVEEVNALMKDAALNGELVNQINYAIDPELVSEDIIGNSCCSVFDSCATIASGDGKSIVLYVWYDNEFGYTKQVIRMAKYIAKVRRLIYY
jgi:glyceraldehyde 3-phosphate dehydrogenase